MGLFSWFGGSAPPPPPLSERQAALIADMWAKLTINPPSVSNVDNPQVQIIRDVLFRAGHPVPASSVIIAEARRRAGYRLNSFVAPRLPNGPAARFGRGYVLGWLASWIPTGAHYSYLKIRKEFYGEDFSLLPLGLPAPFGGDLFYLPPGTGQAAAFSVGILDALFPAKNYIQPGYTQPPGFIGRAAPKRVPRPVLRPSRIRRGSFSWENTKRASVDLLGEVRAGIQQATANHAPQVFSPPPLANAGLPPRRPGESTINYVERVQRLRTPAGIAEQAAIDASATAWANSPGAPARTATQEAVAALEAEMNFRRALIRKGVADARDVAALDAASAELARLRAVPTGPASLIPTTPVIVSSIGLSADGQLADMLRALHADYVNRNMTRTARYFQDFSEPWVANPLNYEIPIGTDLDEMARVYLENRRRVNLLTQNAPVAALAPVRTAHRIETITQFYSRVLRTPIPGSESVVRVAGAVVRSALRVVEPIVAIDIAVDLTTPQNFMPERNWDSTIDVNDNPLALAISNVPRVIGSIWQDIVEVERFISLQGPRRPPENFPSPLRNIPSLAQQRAGYQALMAHFARWGTYQRTVGSEYERLNLQRFVDEGVRSHIGNTQRFEEFRPTYGNRVIPEGFPPEIVNARLYPPRDKRGWWTRVQVPYILPLPPFVFRVNEEPIRDSWRQASAPLAQLQAGSVGVPVQPAIHGGISGGPATGKGREFWLYRGRDRDLMLQTLRDMQAILERDTLAESGKKTLKLSNRIPIFGDDVPGLEGSVLMLIRALKYDASLVRNRGPLGGYYSLEDVL